ncbi:TPA: YbdK family carboxylate-amine ligase [Yersinia enterocolitica]
MTKIPFQYSSYPTIGTELELQLIDLDNFDLSNKSSQIIADYNDSIHVKKELTLSTIEINSSVHATPFTLYEELKTTAHNLSEVATRYNCALCGGGRHITNNWKKQTISQEKRYQDVYQQYGFLAKLSCVFGQHIHIGVENGNDAIYLCHALIPYLPHFIALSASSPYYQSEDTFFDSSRFSALNSFNTFGFIEPSILTWEDFTKYVDKAIALGVIKCIKDIYWEIRPKPEFGTIEIRVCDTPLDIYHAAMLSGYAQLLVKNLLKTRKEIKYDYSSFTNANVFNAQRYGFNAKYNENRSLSAVTLQNHILSTLNYLLVNAEIIDFKVLTYIKDYVSNGINDAGKIRNFIQSGLSEDSVVKAMIYTLLPAEYLRHDREKS